MPIPTPTKSEKESKDGQQKYVSRCISFLNKESPKRAPNQIAAICYTTYKNSKKKKQSKGSQEEPDFDKDLAENNGIFVEN